MKDTLNHSWNSSQYSKTSDLQAAVAEELIKNLHIKPDESVLDIGCGIGNITMEVASIASKGRVLGIDASSSMINQAQKNLSLKKVKNSSFQVMDAVDFNFHREFDVIFSNSTFHWINEQEFLLQSIGRSLKPGGRLGVQFPILDKSHPMVSIVSEAIRRLDLTHHYDKWEFPWFVPESGHKYAELLNNFKYKNVAVKEVETCYTFESTLAVINFFNAVGLDLYLSPLTGEEKILLEGEVDSLVEQQSNADGISLGFHRLYVYANL